MNADDRMKEAMKSLMSLAPRTPGEELVERKTKLAAALRIFGRLGFDEGLAGHITARDPFDPTHFWVNPAGRSFKLMCVSDLIKVDDEGKILEGEGLLNQAAFAIHSRIHKARPDVVAAAHAHSLYGKAWSSLGRLLDPLTQDACAFYQDHGIFDDYTGVVTDLGEGDRICSALGQHKAVILRNHGLLSVGHSVDEAAFWFITMERTCQVQLLAEAAAARSGQAPRQVSEAAARQAFMITGNPYAGWFQFQPLYARIVKEQPDLLE